MNKTTAIILKAGFVTGSLDILLAFVNAWFSSGISPMRVLLFIASGLLGNKAFEQSYTIALLGLAIHFLIAFFWTSLFFVIYPTLKKVARSVVLQGILYGTIVWLVMNLLVLPITRAPKIEFQWLDATKGLFILVIAIGLPLSYFARNRCRFYAAALKRPLK
ncbi:hypothetical protein [Sinomicrobium soli]|uniref:hypothetical protein n=1 Tax=Sinomicrobium sp. N-1-3-6 TaxID=2219864 RepID=UPI000DCE0BBE|nr:hypothetical protein [Sinomicrobium sp. N-1-3-6]RAV29128.1 hypothetical protein DN748_09390 [Sinomicrobium sp. N-1-3-6]